MNLLHMDSAGRKQGRRLEAYRRCCHKRMIHLEVLRYTLGHLDNHLVGFQDIHRLPGFVGPSTALLGLAGMGYLHTVQLAQQLRLAVQHSAHTQLGRRYWCRFETCTR